MRAAQRRRTAIGRGLRFIITNGSTKRAGAARRGARAGIVGGTGRAAHVGTLVGCSQKEEEEAAADIPVETGTFTLSSLADKQTYAVYVYPVLGVTLNTVDGFAASTDKAKMVGYEGGMAKDTETAAAMLRMTSVDLLRFGVINGVLAEPEVGAERPRQGRASRLHIELRPELHGCA
jgi:hypothetical protein